MWLRLSHFYRKICFTKRTIVLQRLQHFVSENKFSGAARPSRMRFVEISFYSTAQTVVTDGDDKRGRGKGTLAMDLASLVEESSIIEERKPRTRMELMRILELRIKKRVKEQYINGKFQDLMRKVIANPKTLRDAYDCIRVNSNVDLTTDGDNLPFESMADELFSGNFDVNANTHSISTRGPDKEVLVFPNVKLKVVQEAIRIVLEVVYKPHFSKISHGGRSGRDHKSALRYIKKEMKDTNWWFTLLLHQKLNGRILSRLISDMQNKIEDPGLYAVIQDMFDVQVLNLEFGGFPKGHGLPQEGVLSPILMNIYLDIFDREIYRMSMNYEALDPKLATEDDGTHSNLRNWIRRQMNGSIAKECNTVKSPIIRIHCCRFLDEIFVAISGSKDIALSCKSDIENYLKNSLHIELDHTNFMPCDGPHSVRFLGTLIKRSLKENPTVRAVHKLKEKVKLFASQKQEAWDAGTVRIGKKCLAHGLKKVKESEIKHLADKASILSQISYFRKAGMETDHWYKLLLKVWMQNINAKCEPSEELILSKHVVEPSVPQELRDSYYDFQKHAKEYVSSETTATLALLPSPNPPVSPFITEIIAPVEAIKKRLIRYGLTNADGFPQMCHILILQDDDHIIHWFSGIVGRWLRWYNECDNLNEVKLIISGQVRMSCIRTLAAKYRIHEIEIEKRFDSLLSRIPSTQEVEQEITDEALSNDDTLFNGMSNYSLCLLSLARMVSQSRPCNCFVMGCTVAAPCVYTLHVMERQKFPGWKTGFSSSIHPCLNRRRIGLCRQHLKDLFLEL
ncbi:nuclear intron maturase 4, mitochondrial-like isoform X2 [Coffea arabica]|uniref:Nuclear intron maturase 4, mitochondrial-like isoform X2 n=1 Tax=Coffea arabica TaxID=13443 RepID=A0ABM4UMF8_COFAR|nr:nuclear intron maturase 4, mitochondrial isoform X2 [Coffea arabica]